LSLEPDDVQVMFEGSRITVVVERWPEGRTREIVRHPGACAAVVFVDEQNVLLVRQMREAVRRETLEVVAGTRDVEGESPEDTIRREILEETGHAAARVEPLGSILTTPGFSTERIDLFVAWAQPAGRSPTEEGITTLVVSFDEAVRMALSGEIEDAKSSVALLLARERLGSR
jgi:ADP-ribose pyrophosphatase